MNGVGGYGRAGRVGLILPADNVVMEPEFGDIGIPDVSFHALRLTETEPERMRAQAIQLADTLLELGVDIAVYACAETSFNAGEGVRTTLSGLIAERFGGPVITATNATIAAVRALGLREVSLVTPYRAESGHALEATLGESGISVRSAVHRDYQLESDDPRQWFVTNRQSPGSVRDFVLRNIDPDADGVVIVSTNLPSVAVIAELETRSGKPVVSSNQAILWWCLGMLDVAAPAEILGSLAAVRLEHA